MMPSTFVFSDTTMGGFKTLRSLLVMRQATFRSALASVSHRGKEDGEGGGAGQGRTGQDRTGQDRTGQDRIRTKGYML